MWIRNGRPLFSNLRNKFKWWLPRNSNKENSSYTVEEPTVNQVFSVLTNCAVKLSDKQGITGDPSCHCKCWFPTFLFIRKASLPMSIDR